MTGTPQSNCFCDLFQQYTNNTQIYCLLLSEYITACYVFILIFHKYLKIDVLDSCCWFYESQLLQCKQCFELCSLCCSNRLYQSFMPYHSDIQHALLSFASTFSPYNRNPLTQMAQFSNGLVFAHMLATVEHFPLTLRELQVETSRWIERLTNLKKIVQKVELYVGQGGKSVRTKDVDLIEIAKHDASEHIQRLFELVIAVFMQSPHKEDYIQTIMRLDQRSQHALVVIVQNAIDQRLTDSNEGLSQAKIMEHLQELTNENELLKEELELSNNQNDKQKRQIVELRQKLEELEEQDEKQRRHTVDSCNEQVQQEIDQLKAMNDNLRQKLFQSMRENQSEMNKLREENIFLQNKLIRFKQYEEAVEHLKEQLAEAQGDRQRSSETQRQKRRQTRLIEEKDAIIAKLKQKIDQINEKNYCMQENQLTMKMELERKQFRFKQLENDVKNRLKAEPFVHNTPLVPDTNTTADAEELDYLQEQVEKLRNSYRELQRQNLKLKKKIDKSAAVQGQKKKLQKIILDVSKSKEVQIQMLLVSLYELRNENVHLHQMIKSA